MGNEQTKLRPPTPKDSVGTGWNRIIRFGSSHLRWRGPFPECTVPHYAEIQECDSMGNL